jgi:hypothetical protein
MSRNDGLFYTTPDGSIEVRGDGQRFVLVRMGDNQELSNHGDLDAATARANALATPQQEPQ